MTYKTFLVKLLFLLLVSGSPQFAFATDPTCAKVMRKMWQRAATTGEKIEAIYLTDKAKMERNGREMTIFPKWLLDIPDVGKLWTYSESLKSNEVAIVKTNIASRVLVLFNGKVFTIHKTGSFENEIESELIERNIGDELNKSTASHGELQINTLGSGMAFALEHADGGLLMTIPYTIVKRPSYKGIVLELNPEEYVNITKSIESQERVKMDLFDIREATANRRIMIKGSNAGRLIDLPLVAFISWAAAMIIGG